MADDLIIALLLSARFPTPLRKVWLMAMYKWLPAAVTQCVMSENFHLSIDDVYFQDVIYVSAKGQIFRAPKSPLNHAVVTSQRTSHNKPAHDSASFSTRTGNSRLAWLDMRPTSKVTCRHQRRNTAQHQHHKNKNKRVISRPSRPLTASLVSHPPIIPGGKSCRRWGPIPR